MQTLLNRTFLCAAAAAATLAAGWAEEAVVDEGKINVRGRPSLIGEVVTQLERGDKVTILERIEIENPKPGEPPVWAKIKLPENTPVWVFSPFIKDGVVTASRLNTRAGPGDNYSILGRIDRGTTVKPIRTIEEWMEIEQPPEAYAFIAVTLVKTSAGQTAAATTASTAAAAGVVAPEPDEEEPAAAPAPASTVAVLTPTPAEPSAARDELQPAGQLSPAVEETQPAPVETAQIAAPRAVLTPVPAGSLQAQPAPPQPQPLPQVAQPAPARPEPAPGKRLVRREGFVRPTKSIQAPTWYELVDAQTKVVVNYLHEERLGVNLNEYRGQKVIVSGEEAIDPRWPNTPILELESLDVAP